MANDSSAENLTLQEFRIIHKKIGLKDLPDYASDISYSHSYDGFLPDYSLRMTYTVPIEIEVDTFDKGEEHQWHHRKSYKIVDNRKIVSISSGQM